MVSGAKQPFLHPKAFYSWLYAGVKVSPSAGRLKEESSFVSYTPAETDSASGLS